MRHMSKRQFNTGDVIQRHTWRTEAFLGVLLVAAVAASPSDPAVLKADIPFPFVVANHTLPAGHYEVSTLGEQTLRIANTHKQGAFVLTSKVAGHSPESSGKLVFYRYQGTYFLAQVWGLAKGSGQQLFKSREEEELESKGIHREISVLRPEE
jgi:hypothetical protein